MPLRVRLNDLVWKSVPWAELCGFVLFLVSPLSKSYLCKQFLLLSEEFFFRDAQVLQSRAGLPPLQSNSFTLLQDVFHLRDVRCETEALERCGAKARGESVSITLCGLRLITWCCTHIHTFQGIGKTKLDSPLMTCSGEMVFFSDLLHISLASEDMRWMNSVQQLTTSSLASLATRTLGRVSLIILLIAALGMVRSSSFPEEEAIVAVDGTETREKRKRNSDTRRKETVTRPSRVGRIKI